MCRRAAARPKCSSSATATKQRRQRMRSIETFTLSIASEATRSCSETILVLFQRRSAGGVGRMQRSLCFLPVLALTLPAETAGAVAHTVERLEVEPHFADAG